MIKQVYLYQLLFSILIVVGAYFVGTPHHALSAAVGCGVVTLNVVLLIWSWSRIINKKSIALPLAVIVFKYAILGVIIYLVTNRSTLDGASFLVGLASIVPTMTLFALLKASRKNQ